MDCGAPCRHAACRLTAYILLIGAGVQYPTFPGNPNRSPRSARVRESSRERAVPRARQARVLVVESESLLGDSLADILAVDFDVTVVSNVTSALELLESGVAYDVILCDVALPPAGGAALLERTRHLAPDMADRFVFVTVGATPADIAEAIAGGAPLGESPIDIRALRGVADWHFTHAVG
jgi:CheY-like chemotaxis protein